METDNETSSIDMSELKKGKSKKKPPQPVHENFESSELGTKDVIPLKIIFEGEAALKMRRLEEELKERLSKPDLGSIIGKEIAAIPERRWSEMVEENTDIEFFFAQIRKSSDRTKSIKLLKGLAEKLRIEDNQNEEPLSLPKDSDTLQ